MSHANSETSANNDFGTQSADALNKDGRFARIWKKLPFRLRTILPPILVFFLVLIAIIVMALFLKTPLSESVGVVASFVSIFTAILAFLTWYNLQKIQYARPRKSVSADSNSAVLVVDVGEKNIWGNVIRYCEAENRFSAIMQGTGFEYPGLFSDANEGIKITEYKIDVPKQDRRIIKVTRPNIIIKRGYDTKFEEQIKDPAWQCYKAFKMIDGVLHENGISELHVFYAGPVFIPFFIAELFSNQYKVNIYHYVPSSAETGTYEYIGVMNHLLYY